MALRTRTGRRRPVLVPAVLAVLTMCLAAPSTPASARADVDFVQQVGLATVTDGAGAKHAAEFAVDSQGGMWEIEQSGSGWTTSPRGVPSAKNGDHTEIRAGAGALGVHQGVRAYVVGQDGDPWEFLHDGAATGWARLDRPPRGAGDFVDAVGTEATSDGMPVVVVRDEYKQLWQYRYVNGRWTTENLGTLPAADGVVEKTAGLAMSSQDVASPLTISNRNVVHAVDKNSEGHWQWFSWGSPPNRPKLSPLGVIGYRNGLIRAFFRSEDGHAWRVTRSTDSQPIKWEDLGTPSNVPLKKKSGGGAQAILTGEQVTAIGEDGKLWNTVAQPVPSVDWKRTLTPSTVTLDKELGSRKVVNDSYTFVTDSDGDMLVAKYSPTTNTWTWTPIS